MRIALLLVLIFSSSLALNVSADQFDKQLAFLSFKSKKDAVYFMLTHGPNNSQRT